MMDWSRRLYDSFFGAELTVAPAFLLLTLAIAFGLYLWRGEAGGFWRWAMPGRIWLHRSHLLDLQLFAIGRAMTLAGIVARVTATTSMAAMVAGAIGDPLIQARALSPVTLAALLWLLIDFMVYWSHRLYHQWSAIWPLHAVHHSAEVLTPFTAYRQHPGAILFSAASQSVALGALQGLLIGIVDPATPVAEIAGVNAAMFIANAALANFHHSHIWISYGPILERLFISPAQHQIHHSADPAHFNRNFGNMLAVWDWIFGTLYLIRDREILTLGLTDPADAPLMTQRLGPVLIDPLRRLFWRSG